MRKFIYLFSLLLFLGCESLDEGKDKDKPEVVVCPTGHIPLYVITVDYTTEKFLGGYYIPLPIIESFKIDCYYKSPGDFGSVLWYDKVSNTKLFGGTIVWMGRGERTFPEEINEPDTFRKLTTSTKMPAFTRLYESEYDRENTEEVDYASIWKAVEKLEFVSWVGKSTDAYIYLYRPSVGVGDPRDWYWVIFLRN